MSEPPTVSRHSSDASPTWVPVDACTLPTVGQPVRVAEFDELFAERLTATQHPAPTSARFVLAGQREVSARAQELADRETGCCSFFTFDVTVTGPSSFEIAVTVPHGRADVLAALVERAEAARRSTQGVREA
jgi:hypothetical protein